MPKAKVEQQQEARRLRLETRASLAEIANTLGAAKSSVSAWLHDIPLTEEEKRRRFSRGAEISLQRARERKLVCTVCNSEFVGKSTRSKYCSKRCLNQARPKRKSNSQAVVGWRRRNKERAVEYKGGECQVCGYSRCIRAMKFHHLDPSKKDFGISEYIRSWKKVEAELDKCLLVCGNCHDEIHDGLIDVGDYIAPQIAA